jgi:flagellar secretion chaperone FliS
MTANTNYTNQYLATQVNSATPEQLLLMFYDGAIRFSALAVQSIDDEDIEKRNYYINKASAIISELAASLNHDIGAIATADLDALYNFMLKELMTANIKNDPEPIIQVKKMLTDLRETWNHAIALNNEEKNKSSQTANHTPVFQNA